MNQSVDLTLLETFYEVTRLGSATAAARALGRSQPAVSHRLRALEDDLGVPLFEKIGRRLALTDHGRALRAHCVEVMAMARTVREAVRPGGGDIEGQVTIGTLPTVTAHLLVPVLTDLLVRAPRVQMTFVFDFVPALCERLRTGELQLVVAIGHAETAGLEVERLGGVGLVAAMSPAMSRSLPRGAPTVSALRRLRLLVWGGPSDPTFDLVRAFAERNRLVSPWAIRIPHIETLRELAAAGAGYAILPGYAVRREVERGRLVALPLRTPRSDVCLISRRGQLVTPAIAAVRDALRAIRGALRRAERTIEPRRHR